MTSKNNHRYNPQRSCVAVAMMSVVFLYIMGNLQLCRAFPLSHHRHINVRSTAIAYQINNVSNGIPMHRSPCLHYRRRQYKQMANIQDGESFQRSLLSARIANDSTAEADDFNINDKHDDGMSAEDRILQQNNINSNYSNVILISANNKRSLIKQLFSILVYSPMNLFAVVLFHMLGVYQATNLFLTKLPPSISTLSSSKLLFPLVMNPSIWIVLLSLLLITSMVTSNNTLQSDGVDDILNYRAKASEISTNNDDNNTFSINKTTFDTYLYAILLLLSSSIGGVIPRLMLQCGAILSYLYTTHLRRKMNKKSWITNISSSVGWTMIPITSGLAACHILRDASFLSKVGIFIGGATLDNDGLVTTLQTLPFDLLFKSPLGLLSVALCGLIMSREMIIVNSNASRKAGKNTVVKPSSKDRRNMMSMALGCTIVTAAAACSSSIVPFYNIITALLTDSESRKAVLSVWGSIMLTWRAWRVWSTKGKNVNVLAERATREGAIYAVMILASFL